MFQRLLNPLSSHSFFLFGARGTGKSTFLKTYLKDEKKLLWIDLLDFEQEQHYQRYPQDLKKRILANPKAYRWVVIDEVQRAPKLLDVVHQLIESRVIYPAKICFALTGSSARKLKRGSANMLAGRAFLNTLYPLTFLELDGKFNLQKALSWGTLPKVLSLTSDEAKTEFLKSYTLTFLKEEIKAEQIVRNLEPFGAFLEIAAQANGEIVNYYNIAKDVGVSSHTIQSYFQILEDTLLGYFLLAHHQSVRKQQRQSPKFYFFDLGICRALQGLLDQKVKPKTYGFGRYFESLVILELMRLNTYYRRDFRFSYLRTKDNAEIDLIVTKPGRPIILIEIKSSEHVDERDVSTLENFKKDFGPKTKTYVLSMDPLAKKIGSTRALFWQEGIQEILK